MLNAIRIRNLRSLQDTGLINIRPITILVGENSSGKSTFLRTFPLLKQSAESNTRSSILWFGQYVDFGDFDQAKSRISQNKEIIFSFEISIPTSTLTTPIHFHRPNSKDNKTTKILIDLRLASKGKDGLTRTSGINLEIESNKIRIEISEQGKISEIEINENDYSDFSETMSYVPASGLLPTLRAKEDKSTVINYDWREAFTLAKVQDGLVDTLKKFSHGNAEEGKLLALTRHFVMGTDEETLESIKKSTTSKIWASKISPLNVQSTSFKRIRDLNILSKIPIILLNIDTILESTCKNVSYIAPIRASAERYYRSQDLSVRELDYKGENLAMFVRNLSEKEKSGLDDWTNEHFGFHLEVKYNGGHVIAGIEYATSKEYYNIADMGFGFSQVMPIIVQVWTLINKPKKSRFEGINYTYAIEQPELHLHPRMQAKIAEVLAKTVTLSQKSGVKLNLIIETHSESIINKMGMMVSKGEILHDDTNIIVFSKSNESSPSAIEISKFDEEGTLINWPYGFFDIEV